MAIYNRQDYKTALPQLEKEFNARFDGLLDFFYPVGCYFETSDTTFNPNITWGGTWVLETEGQVHVSAGLNYEVGGALTNETDGGEATVTLTVDEMPSHNHTQNAHSHQTDNYLSSGASATYTLDNVKQKHGYDHWTSSAQPYIQPTGGGQAHNNMPPYIIVNRWHRVK